MLLVGLLILNAALSRGEGGKKALASLSTPIREDIGGDPNSIEKAADHHLPECKPIVVSSFYIILLYHLV